MRTKRSKRRETLTDRLESSSTVIAGGQHRSRRLNSWFLFFGVLVVLLILKWPTLNQLPVWDTSMSVFPAAITLAESGFDLPDLLGQPGFRDGGPNVHALSPVTWLTAAALATLPGEAVLPALHLTQLGLAAAALTVLYVMVFPVLGQTRSLIAVGITLLLPIFRVQSGFLYLEIPLLLATIAAFKAWIDRRYILTSVWLAIAVAIKPTGVITVAAIGLATIVLENRRHEDLKRSLLTLGPALALAAFSYSIASASVAGMWNLTYSQFLSQFIVRYLRFFPDILIAGAVFLAVILLSREEDPSERVSEMRLLILAFTAIFVAFYLALPLVTNPAPIFPRYMLQLMPLLIVGILISIPRGLDRVVQAFALIIAGVLIVNSGGILYAPVEPVEFTPMERSNEYLELLELQILEAETVSSLPPEIPVFYTLAMHYRTSFPRTGYVRSPHPLGVNVLVEEPYTNGILGDFPASFYMVIDFQWLGGETLISVLQQALADPTRAVEITAIVAGDYESILVYVGLSDDDA